MTRIAIDIDDTLAEATEALRLLVNKRAGVEIPPEAYQVRGDYWGYYERVWGAHELNGRVSFDDFAEEMVADQTHVPLLPGAQFAVQQLMKQHEVILITARDVSWEAATKRWLETHFPGSTVQLYFSSNHRDAKGKSKGQLCKELGATLLVDDNVEHCESALAEGVDAILFGEYGWQHRAGNHLVRCRDWQAVLEYIGA